MPTLSGIAPADAYDYLVLARQKLLGWVQKLTLEQFAREFPIGHRSARATLVHVASAEWGYVRRLRGEPVPPPGERPFASSAAQPLAPLEAAWAAQAEETRRTLREVDDWTRPLVFESVTAGRRRRFRTTTGGWRSSCSSTRSTTGPGDVHAQADGLPGGEPRLLNPGLRGGGRGGLTVP